MNAGRFHLILLLGLSITVVGCGDDTSSFDTKDAATGDGDGDGDGDQVTLPATCEQDVECDNGLYCDGQESCTGGTCVAGTRVACDDGIDCTVDACVEDSRTCSFTAPDRDGDGHVDITCLDADGEPLGLDCDDEDALRYPGNIEICDPVNRDEDCDPSTLGFRDGDNDGFVDALCCNAEDDSPGAALHCGTDCDDLKPNVHPSATEACDRFDNDCDGSTDEGVSVMLFPDADRDGHGSDAAPAEPRCAGAVGFSTDANDCNDNDPEVFKGQFEICDGKDNNCDDSCDGQAPGCTDNIDEVQQHAPWFADADGDGFGSALGQPILSCIPIPGRRMSNNDCDDADPAIHPAASEACDGVDNDCNGLRDFQIGLNDFEDDDGDGLADAACVGGGDCDDRNAATGAGLDEICDRIDNDCDGATDEQTVQTVWYLDQDGDGWGVGIGNALASCDPLPGRSSKFGDCADGENARHPGAAELCNGVDDDCDGAIDEQASFLCHLDNAVARCGGPGVCQIYSCVSGFADDDEYGGNGCEAVAVPVPIPGSCISNSECDDELYCNGKEYCDTFLGSCFAGTPINCQPDVQGDVHILDSLSLVQLQGVEVIAGHVLIDATDIRSLSGLEDLRVIGGNLIIIGADDLRRLSGSALSNLEFVGGHIIIENNAELLDVNLPSLISARSLQVRNNPKLLGVVGYPNLISLEDGLSVTDNAALTQIGGFGALAVIDGGVYDPLNEGVPQPAFEIASNPMLADLSGFGSLQRIRGGVDLYECPLTSLTLPALEKLGGSLQAYLLPALGDMSFPSLLEVGSDIVVNHCPVVSSLGLDVLQYAGGLYVANTSSLTSIDLPELQQVGLPDPIDGTPPIRASKSIEIYLPFQEQPNTALTQISAPKLQAVIGDVYIESQPMLQSVMLPELAMVGGELWFYDDDALGDIDLAKLMAAGRVAVVDNDVVVAVKMPAITQIGGTLEVGNNALLQSIALPQLMTVDEDLLLYDNLSLSSIDMQNLTTAGTYVAIANNDSLTDLDGLANLNDVLTPPDAFSGVEVCDNDGLLMQVVTDFLAQFSLLAPEQLHEFCGQG